MTDGLARRLRTFWASGLENTSIASPSHQNQIGTRCGRAVGPDGGHPDDRLGFEEPADPAGGEGRAGGVHGRRMGRAAAALHGPRTTAGMDIRRSPSSRPTAVDLPEPRRRRSGPCRRARRAVRVEPAPGQAAEQATEVRHPAPALRPPDGTLPSGVHVRSAAGTPRASAGAGRCDAGAARQLLHRVGSERLTECLGRDRLVRPGRHPESTSPPSPPAAACRGCRRSAGALDRLATSLCGRPDRCRPSTPADP